MGTKEGATLETEPCAQCNGEGSWRSEQKSDSGTMHVKFTCRSCQGRGFVVADTQGTNVPHSGTGENRTSFPIGESELAKVAEDTAFEVQQRGDIQVAEADSSDDAPYTSLQKLQSAAGHPSIAFGDRSKIRLLVSKGAQNWNADDHERAQAVLTKYREVLEVVEASRVRVDASCEIAVGACDNCEQCRTRIRGIRNKWWKVRAPRNLLYHNYVGLAIDLGGLAVVNPKSRTRS
jgi:hypothetical protein